MKRQLQEDVPQLLRRFVPVLFHQGAGSFVGLLQQVFGQADMGLLPIPGAAVFGAQNAHDGQQILRIILGALRKRYGVDDKAAGWVIHRLAVQFCELKLNKGPDSLLTGREEMNDGVLPIFVQQFQLNIARQLRAGQFDHTRAAGRL